MLSGIKFQILGVSLLGKYLQMAHLILFCASIAKDIFAKKTKTKKQKTSLLFSNSLYSITIPYLDCIPLYVKFREYIYKYSVDFFGVLKKLYYGAYVNIFLFLLPDHKLALTPGFET